MLTDLKEILTFSACPKCNTWEVYSILLRVSECLPSEPVIYNNTRAFKTKEEIIYRIKYLNRLIVSNLYDSMMWLRITCWLLFAKTVYRKEEEKESPIWYHSVTKFVSNFKVIGRYFADLLSSFFRDLF